VRALRFILIACLAILLAPAAGWAAGRFVLLPSLVLLGEYSDNILLTPEDSEDDKLADFSVTALPGLRLRYDSYRSEAFIGAAVGFRHYFEYDEYDGLPEFYQGAVGWSYWLNPLVKLTLLDELTFYTDPRDNPLAEQQPDIESLRTESIANRLGCNVLYTATRVSSFETGYTFGTTEYTEEDLADTVEHQFTFTWNRQINPAFRLSTFYNYTRALFAEDYDFLRQIWDDEYTTDPPFPFELEEENDFDTHVPGVGLQYQATPSLSFEFRSGLIFPASMYRNDVYRLDDIDWYQRIEATKNFWRMTAAANYTRNVAPAHGLAGAVLTQTVAGRLQERWTRQFETLQDVGYSNYLQDAADIDAVRAGVGANYYFFNWLGVGLAYSFLHQVGHYEDTDAQRLYAHRVTLRTALTSPRPDWLRF